MGPLRTAWTFPYSGKELVETCVKRQEQLVAEIDASLDAEKQYEVDLAEYRESLRKVGVKNWESAVMEQSHTRYSNPQSTQRQRQSLLKKQLDEITRFRRQLEHDLARDEHRLYKLTIDDVIYFGL